MKAVRWPDASEPVLVIGHQPTLGFVASYLLSEQPQSSTIKKGAIWCLRGRHREDTEQVILHAVQSPDCLQRAAEQGEPRDAARAQPVRYHGSIGLAIPEPCMGQVTQLLSAIGQGERDALGELYALLYADLHRLAHSRVRRSGDLTLLDTTSLVHESYLRFEKSGALRLGDRAQFMAYAARVMRSVVVDLVRRRQSERRGGTALHVEYDEANAVAPADLRHSEVLRVHESLDELGAIDARLVQVVEMRYFAGMTEPEIAEVLGLTVRTVARDWEKARLFLHASLR